MTMAFGRDFVIPTQPQSTRQLAAEGLRSLLQAGNPVTHEVVREWARQRRFTEQAVERYVEQFREIGRGS
jgi:hypothetical protein